ncbi:MAG: hypothetical protein K2X82_04330 [Gemmataceae bacterium]|nr:hypothetical protein [Gemmataceae bacterium]
MDNDLPGYAGLGKESSLWVAVAEKAYAHYRTGANTYASLSGGWGVDVNRAFGAAASGSRYFGTTSDGAELAEFVARKWEAKGAVTIGFLRVGSGVPIVGSHMYSVASVARDAAGKVVSITVRNPWGVDGGGSRDGNTGDGLVTLTPAQIVACTGGVCWGRV